MSLRSLANARPWKAGLGYHEGACIAPGRAAPKTPCEPEDRLIEILGQAAGFSLHAGVAVKSDQRSKLERLCRYIARPPVCERRLSLTPTGQVH